MQAGVDITDAATLGPALWEGVTQAAIAVGPVFGKLPGGGMGCAPPPGAVTQLALAAAVPPMGADGVRRAACMTPPCALRAHAGAPAHWADTTSSCWGLASTVQAEVAAFSNPEPPPQSRAICMCGSHTGAWCFRRYILVPAPCSVNEGE